MSPPMFESFMKRATGKARRTLAARLHRRELRLSGKQATVSFTFDEPGLHNYDCSFHATDMKGSVLVTDA